MCKSGLLNSSYPCGLGKGRTQGVQSAEHNVWLGECLALGYSQGLHAVTTRVAGQADQTVLDLSPSSATS